MTHHPIPLSNVTIIMSICRADDFTNAALYALREVYPDVQVVLSSTDAHSSPTIPPGPTWLVSHDGWSSDEGRNACGFMVDTPYVLFMDNDVKVLGPGAIEACLEAIDNSFIAQSGAYGVKVADWLNRRAYVGTEFINHMWLDAVSGYWSLHQTDAFQAVGGFPKSIPFYPSTPANLITPHLHGTNGDLSITKLYNQRGWVCYSPARRVPVLHWGGASRWQVGENALDRWWKANVHHVRCDPLNAWKDKEACR